MAADDRTPHPRRTCQANVTGENTDAPPAFARAGRGIETSTLGLLQGAGLAFRNAQVAVDAILVDDLGVVLRAVIGLLNPLVRTNIRTLEASVALFGVNSYGHGVYSD
jgi:hypothetical protein